ncbi:MAG: S8 family serine peptidase [Deltaproteobacteria bacterium]|nr:S8 family serine peptidase [Deltaproteobacteria bacterium]
MSQRFLSANLRTKARFGVLALSLCGCQPQRTDATGQSASGAEQPAARDAEVHDAGPSDAVLVSEIARSPWDSHTQDSLRRLVREHAHRKLAEHAPQLNLARLADYAQDAQSAPELSGKAVDELMNLALVALTENEPRQALALVSLCRARARNRNSAFVGNLLFAEATRVLAGDDPAAQTQALLALFSAMPMVRFQGATVAYQLFQRVEQLDARLGNVRRSMVTPETATAVLQTDVLLRHIVQVRSTYLAAVEQARAAFEQRPPRTAYAFSTVDLQHQTGTRPVQVAVWDTGTATSLFASQLATNERETLNGRDDDGNGMVDDRHGIYADPDSAQRGYLYDPGAETITQYAGYLRGVMDLRAGMASTPAAQRVLTLVRSVTTAEAQEQLDQRLDAIGEWAHGTHVAGILLAGVPGAQLSVFRSAWAGESRVYRDRGPTDAELDAELHNADEIGQYIRLHHVRVVNASLGFSREYIEEQLRHETQRYQTDEQVRARAVVIHERRRATWTKVISECPETLFVVAAGNSNQDVVEYDVIPASLPNLANLLVVGAVDRYGDWAVFTNSNMQRVRVFDLGVEVDSVIPNGERTPLSGTSMASPNVANLAAKMLSVNPRLRPAQVVSIIESTGDPIASPFVGRIANEARAIVHARRGR